MRDFRVAMMWGTTRPTAMLVGIATVLHGLGILSQTWWLYLPQYIALVEMFPLYIWVVLYIGTGIAVVWRVLSNTSNPICAWAINTAHALVWCLTVALKLWFAGGLTIFSTHTAIALATLWLLTRTEATPRDREVA